MRAPVALFAALALLVAPLGLRAEPSVERGRGGFVVLDTAPTGHTILLLNAALAYHR